MIPALTRIQASSRSPLCALISPTLHTSSSSLTTSNTTTAAANRFPDKVDADPEGTRRLNVQATRTLARLCAQQGILLIYISTDYVFSGKPGEAPYEADAQTGPTNLYGQTKLDGERAVLEEYERAGKDGLGVVLRVPVLYGEAEMPAESAVNVLMDVVWKAQGEDAKKVKMDHWALRYPTNTEDCGRVAAGEFLALYCEVVNMVQMLMTRQISQRITSRPPTSLPYPRYCSSRVKTSIPSTRCAKSLVR